MRIQQAVDAVLRNLSVRRAGASYVLEVEFKSQDRNLSAAVANEFVNTYVRDQVQFRSEQMQRTSLWLESRLTQLRDQSAAAERDVQTFRQQNNLVDANGKLNEKVEIPLPVDGLLNPELAHRFDDFTEKNSAYSLSPLTIAMNLDKDFPDLHPKQLRRVVLGPFYSAGITQNNSVVADVLAKVRKPENAWLLTWTIQEVYSKAEKPGHKGLWSSQPAEEEFFIDTDDLEATRQGVSSYENHALVPHEAYQALYAAGEAQKTFAGYKVHILSNGQVISDV